MRILVIGAGSIGRRHAANLTALGVAADLLPWRETSADDVAARLAGGAYGGAVIATATDVRLPLVLACAGKGVPFYCEKPLAFRQQELDAILVAAAPVAARSMVGFMMRYHAAFRALAKSDLSGVFRLALAIGHDVTQWRANWRFADSYAARVEGGGVLLDLCHEIDMAACLFPGLDLVSVESLGHADHAGVDMASLITLRDGHRHGTVAMDYLCPRLVRHTRLEELHGIQDFDYATGVYQTIFALGAKVHDLPQDRNAMFMDAMRDFLALASGRAPSDNPHLPRLDRVASTCRLIARAWEARRFTGTIAKDLG
ncbi:MAG: Gfo/Idh/MocA family protein [Gemmobacter sp.]